jgi:hypothetical protein
VHFVIECRDKPGHAALRAATRQAHLDYLKGFAARIVAAGPFLSADGAAMTGSLLIVGFEDLAAAEAFAAEDPYRKAGLFASVRITPWRKVYPAG